MTRLLPAFALCAVAALGGITATGCSSTVRGNAVKARVSVPDDVPPLTESALEGLLLSNKDLDSIVGVELESFYTSDELNENSDLVSDLDCLGAVYPGEKEAYADTDWSAVRDELLFESLSEDESHLVEQTIVLFDTADDATRFFEQSRDQWRDCAKAKDITADDFDWTPSDVKESGERLISQDAEGSIDGTCQHAMGVVANLIVEGFSCSDSGDNAAEAIVATIVEEAAGK